MNDSLREACNGTGIQQGAPLGWIMAAQAWAWTLSCVGGVGNLATICTIAHQLYLGRPWRRRYGSAERPVLPLEGDTLLLLHLTICDFLYCAINLPITAITYSYALGGTHLQPSKAFCRGAGLFRYANALAEWITLGLLAVQRCVDLGRAQGAKFFRPRLTLVFIAGVWVGSVVVLLGTFIGDDFDYNCKSYKCDIMSYAGKMYFFSLLTLLPCVMMLTGCCSIIFQIWRSTRKLLSVGMPKEFASQRSRSTMRSTMLLLMLLFLFLVCVIPICVYTVHSLFSERKVALGIAIFMVYWIQYAINFIVYAVINENYRTAYRQFLMLLVTWVKRLGQAILNRAVKQPGRNKAKNTDPVTPTAHAVLPPGNTATSIALLPLGTSWKGSLELCLPDTAAHSHGTLPLPPSLPCFRRCNSEHLAIPELSTCSTINTLTAATIPKTPNTTICPLSLDMLGTSSTINTATAVTIPKRPNTTTCPLSLELLSTSSTADTPTTTTIPRDRYTTTCPFLSTIINTSLIIPTTSTPSSPPSSSFFTTTVTKNHHHHHHHHNHHHHHHHHHHRRRLCRYRYQPFCHSHSHSHSHLHHHQLPRACLA